MGFARGSSRNIKYFLAGASTMEVYKQVFKLGLIKTFQYRVNFYFGLISVCFPLLIQVFLWKGLYSSAPGGILFGYTFSEMMMYAAFACLLAKIISATFIYEINEDIKNGGLAKYLVRPVNYRLYRFFEYLGEKVCLMLCSILLLLAIYIIGNYAAHKSFTMVHFIIFLPVVSLATLLNFSIFYAVAGIGFWMRESSGMLFIISLTGNIISGGIFPLDIFPGIFRAIFKVLPFQYTNYFSVSVLCGTLSARQILAGIILQLLWTIVCSEIGYKVWKAGLKNYTAVGG
jgi:ABC-2 type transport system permease protein